MLQHGDVKSEGAFTLGPVALHPTGLQSHCCSHNWARAQPICDMFSVLVTDGWLWIFLIMQGGVIHMIMASGTPRKCNVLEERTH